MTRIARPVARPDRTPSRGWPPHSAGGRRLRLRGTPGRDRIRAPHRPPAGPPPAIGVPGASPRRRGSLCRSSDPGRRRRGRTDGPGRHIPPRDRTSGGGGSDTSPGPARGPWRGPAGRRSRSPPLLEGVERQPLGDVPEGGHRGRFEAEVVAGSPVAGRPPPAAAAAAPAERMLDTATPTRCSTSARSSAASARDVS